ncbi:MAG: CDP-glycerol glycerophosphotransferase family protein, partial [Calditrichaceae bacterium]
MQIHYFANQVYQYSNAIPLYKEIDGIFIVKKTKRSIQFIKYFRNGNFSPNHRSFLNTPPYEKISKNEIPNLTGALISLSNYAIHHDSNRLKTIFIGHGSGDKKYGSKFRSLETYDYHFLSGPKHLEKLKDMGLNIPEEKLIKIGNLRFDDYLNGKIDKDQVLNRLGIKDKSRKNILYAPTWKWGDGTLLTYAKPFAEELTKEHNLIIRPHHHDRIHIRKLKIWTILNNLEHVYFSNPA